jgi:filamentous hemagglutinin
MSRTDCMSRAVRSLPVWEVEALGAAQGAAGAGLSAVMAKQLDDIYRGVGEATGSGLLGNLAANVVAGVGGVLFGGTAGVAIALNVELYNPSLRRKSQDLVSQVCPAGAPCSDAVLDAAIQVQRDLNQAVSKTATISP